MVRRTVPAQNGSRSTSLRWGQPSLPANVNRHPSLLPDHDGGAQALGIAEQGRRTDVAPARAPG
jgi:hypothetical protein